MARMKPESAQVSWQDVSIAVLDWEAHYGVDITCQLAWRYNLTAGAFVEVIISEGGAIGKGTELTRSREAFPARKATGQPGAVLWAISSALRCMENEPWLWSRKMRRRAQGEG